MTDIRSPAETHQRILFLLFIAKRALRIEELKSALALRPSEADRACQWLAERGHISICGGAVSMVPPRMQADEQEFAQKRHTRRKAA